MAALPPVDPDMRTLLEQLRAARRVRLGLDVEPGACLMIDDQARNIEGAKAAGLLTRFFEADGLAALRARLAAEGALS